MYYSSSSSEGSRTSKSQKHGDSSHVTDYLKKLDEKLGNLEANITKNTQLTNNKTKKLKKKLININKAKIFKHKGNERNYLFNLNLSIFSHICSAGHLLTSMAYSRNVELIEG